MFLRIDYRDHFQCIQEVMCLNFITVELKGGKNCQWITNVMCLNLVFIEIHFGLTCMNKLLLVAYIKTLHLLPWIPQHVMLGLVSRFAIGLNGVDFFVFVFYWLTKWCTPPKGVQGSSNQ